MIDPICRRCGTDDFLKYSGSVPPQDGVRVFRTHQSGIRRPHHTPAYVHFTCLACGLFNGHAVPDEWSVPNSNPRAKPDRRSDADGIVRV